MKKPNGKPKPRKVAEYDFSQGARGKYASRFAAGSHVVVISPDVAKHFPNSRAVNAALRSLMSGKLK